jgi:uncharacterized Tic20 family protein
MVNRIEPEVFYSDLKKREIKLDNKKSMNLLQQKIRNQVFIDSLVYVFISIMLLYAVFIAVVDISGISDITLSIVFMFKYILLTAFFYIATNVFVENIKGSKGGYYEENQSK